MAGHWIAVAINVVVGLTLVWVLVRTIQGRPIERRIVFVYIALAVATPLFMKLEAPLAETPEVQSIVTTIKELPPGSRILISFDYDPQSAPELQPMAEAFIKFAFKQRHKVIIMGLWPLGPDQANQAIRAALEDPSVAELAPEYGVDYVNLGFQSGNEFVIQGMGSAFKNMFPQDERGTIYDNIPILRGVTNFSNVDYVQVFSSGKPGTREWVQVAADRFGATVGGGTTAVQAPEMYPFLRSNQLIGLMGGMTGAAEFEKAVEELGKANTFLLSQMFAHATVIVFVIFGNIAYFRSRRRDASTDAPTPGGIS